MSQNSQIPFHDPAALSGNPRPIVALAGDYQRGHEIEPHRHARAQLVYASKGIMTVTASFCCEEGQVVWACRARPALRTRVNMSAIGSVIIVQTPPSLFRKGRPRWRSRDLPSASFLAVVQTVTLSPVTFSTLS